MSTKDEKTSEGKKSRPCGSESESLKEAEVATGAEPHLQRLRELLAEDNWDEDSSIYISQAHFHAPPRSSRKPSSAGKSGGKSGKQKMVLGLITAVVTGLVGGAIKYFTE